MYFNVFEAAPENERDGPNQQAAHTASGKVGLLASFLQTFDTKLLHSYPNISCKRYDIDMTTAGSAVLMKLLLYYDRKSHSMDDQTTLLSRVQAPRSRESR